MFIQFTNLNATTAEESRRVSQAMLKAALARCLERAGNARDEATRDFWLQQAVHAENKLDRLAD